MAVFLQQLVGVRSTPLECLDGMKGMDVNEKVSHIEAITAIFGQEIEMANKYQVYAPGGMDDKFYAVEQTNFIGRNMKQCFGDCAPWQLDIAYCEGHGKEIAFHMERPASWTCCCINRPVAHMTDSDGTLIGSMRDHYPLCGGLRTYILDPEGNKVIKFDAGECQWGFFCPLPCGWCSEINFDIIDVESGATLGNMTKKVPSMLKFLYAPDVDDYHVNFEGVGKPEYKALIMAMTMFIDFRYFNDNSNDSRPRQQVIDELKEAAGMKPEEEA